MNNYIETTYKFLPIFLQNVALSIYGYFWKRRRFGGIFKVQLLEFSHRENYSKSDWYDYQTQELRRLLKHSFTNVPYYRKKYTEAGFNLHDLKHFELTDLKNLPYLEKEDLRKYGTSSLLSDNKGKGSFISSSGSTGTPTSIFFTKSFHQEWSAVYELRVRNWAGVNYNMRRGMIGGRKIIPDALATPPYYRYNYFERQTYFSAYHLSPKTVADYMNGLKRNKVEYLVGYAMSLYFWADFINNDSSIEPIKLKAVLTSSEKLTNEMRAVIEKAFTCKVFDAYSGVEACGLISENEFGELLFSPDTGILEIIDGVGEYVVDGEVGEVCSTGFLNYDQPLIRYRIGDRVKLSSSQSSKSNLEFPIIEEIEGRLEDVVIGADGRKMVRFHSLFIDVNGLKSAQIVQHEIDFVEIKLIIEDCYSKNSERIISERLTSQLGPIQIKYNYVNKIPLTNSGKFKAVISNIS